MASINATSHLDDVRARALVDPYHNIQSQRKLFRHVELDRPSRCIAFRTVLHARPRVASCVRSLTFSAAAVPEIAATLAVLPEVHELSAEELVVDNGYPRLTSKDTPRSNAVIALTLRRPTFTSPSALHALIAGFPNLRTLNLLDTTVHPGLGDWGKAATAPFDVFALLRLRELRLHAPHVPGEVAAVVGDTLGQSIASLDTLRFTLGRQSSVGMLYTLLEHVGPGLSSLELDLRSCRADADVLLSGIDLSSASNLTTLSIVASLVPVLSADREYGDAWDDFITPFFEKKLPNRLRNITLELHVRPADWQMAGAIQWERLDVALASTQFGELEQVKAVVCTQMPISGVQDRLRNIVHARAATLRSRGLLRVEFGS